MSSCLGHLQMRIWRERPRDLQLSPQLNLTPRKNKLKTKIQSARAEFAGVVAIFFFQTKNPTSYKESGIIFVVVHVSGTSVQCCNAYLLRNMIVYNCKTK